MSEPKYTSVLHTKERMNRWMVNQDQTRLKVEEKDDGTFRVTVQSKSGFIIPLAWQTWGNERVEHAHATKEQADQLMAEFEARAEVLRKDPAFNGAKPERGVTSVDPDGYRLRFRQITRNGAYVLTTEQCSIFSAKKVGGGEHYGNRRDLDKRLAAFEAAAEKKRDQGCTAFGGHCNVHPKA